VKDESARNADGIGLVFLGNMNLGAAYAKWECGTGVRTIQIWAWEAVRIIDDRWNSLNTENHIIRLAHETTGVDIPVESVLLTPWRSR
jgi:hypothetical protein